MEDRSQNAIVKWPFGQATVMPLSASGAQGIAVKNMLTILDGASVVATADRTVNITASETLEVGARIILKTKSNATEKVLCGTGIKGEAITGVAGKTQVAEYVYDGAAFIQTGKFIQID